MAGVPQQTLAWLYNVLTHEYHDANRTYSDLAHVLTRHPGLAPRTDVHTFENGASALLVHFKGTIPVNFRGSTYRFPISLWIPHSYPYEPPICYVAPTEDMMIRPGQHVGADGKIYHPYLAHWRESWERSNVLDFLSLLSDIFAKEPPVVSRASQQHQQQQRSSQPAPPPIPPLPREIQQPQHHPHGNNHVKGPPMQPGASTPPPPPPKQPAQGFSTQSPTSQGPAYQNPGRYHAPPPLPQSPGQASPGSQQPYIDGNVQRRPSGFNYMPQRSSSLRQSMPPLQQPQPQPQLYDHERQPHQQPPYPYQPTRPGEPQQIPPHQYPLQVPNPASPPPGSSGYDQARSPRQGQAPPAPQFYPAGQPPAPHQQPHPAHPYPTPASINPYAQSQPHPPYQQPHQHPQQAAATATVKPPRPPTPNLLDSPFDLPLPSATGPGASQTSNIPAPPIPRNPEKEALLTHLSHQITQSLHSQIEQSNAALGPLSTQHAAMQSTLQTLSAELNNLQSLHSTLSSNISLLSTSLSKSDTVIASARQRAQQNDIPRVDEMLVPPTVVARQLYDAACEERGIEAAILALQEGFVRGRVGGDVWARRTRELAREEFKRRWMERKVAKGMGLDLAVYGHD